MAKMIGETEKKAVKNSPLCIFVRHSAPETWMEWMWCDGMEILNSFIVVDEKGEEKVLWRMWSFDKYFVVDATLDGDSVCFRARHSWQLGYEIKKSLTRQEGYMTFERDASRSERRGV